MNWKNALVLFILIVLLPTGSFGDAMAPDPFNDQLSDSLSHLIQLSAEKDELQAEDLADINHISDFISEKKDFSKYTPQEYDFNRGSFITFSVNRSLTDIVRYAYNPIIPEGAITPCAINFTSWDGVSKNAEPFPEIWKSLSDLSKPFSFSGTGRVSIAPDLNTGAYYEYKLHKRFIGLSRDDQRIFLSLSRQMGSSDVGKIGYIVGNENDWNYIYTQKKGLNKKGLSWVKSKIYNYYSVCVLIETKPGVVKIGMFQWLGAGWLGMNVVDSHHIRKGLVRYAHQFKEMLESQSMPSPKELEQISQSLANTSESVLREKAIVVVRHLKNLACKDQDLEKIDAIKNLDETAYVNEMTKAQLMNTLMREFVKLKLGKPTPLKSTFWVALEENKITKQKSRS